MLLSKLWLVVTCLLLVGCQTVFLDLNRIHLPQTKKTQTLVKEPNISHDHEQTIMAITFPDRNHLEIEYQASPVSIKIQSPQEPEESALLHNTNQENSQNTLPEISEESHLEVDNSTEPIKDSKELVIDQTEQQKFPKNYYSWENLSISKVVWNSVDKICLVWLFPVKIPLPTGNLTQWELRNEKPKLNTIWSLEREETYDIEAETHFDSSMWHLQKEQK